MTRNEESIEVAIEVPTPEPEPAPEEDGATVVVVEDSSDTPTEVVIDHAERIAILERENEELRMRVSDAQFSADLAQEAANVAIDVAVETAEVAEESDAEVLEAVDETVDDLEDEINDELTDDSLLGEDEEPPIDVAPASARKHPLFRSWSEWREGR